MADAPTPLSYLALGDSYTIGEGVPEAGRWPVRLAQALREEGIALEAPRIIAEPLGPFDFVTLLIGVNNQYRNRSAVGYAGELHTLLKRAIKFAHGRADRVMVLSIPDWGVTPFARDDKRDAATIGAEIDAFNAAARKVCEGEGVAFDDITPCSREHGASMLAEDGLHPSADMYALWSQQALPVARTLLSR